MVVGDWGFDASFHVWRGVFAVRSRCQSLLADSMRLEAEMRGDVSFVINVGDSFYPQGTYYDDTQWHTKWGDVYGKIPRPRKVCVVLCRWLRSLA